jgi:hypothetical protein
MEAKQDALARAYATLSSLRKNIGEITTGVRETYVHEFHSVLDKLENIGIDVSEFRIPDSEIAIVVRSFNTLTGVKSYSDEKYVDKPFILTKLDAILGYFEITMSEKPRSIGFHTPDK